MRWKLAAVEEGIVGGDCKSGCMKESGELWRSIYDLVFPIPTESAKCKNTSLLFPLIKISKVNKWITWVDILYGKCFVGITLYCLYDIVLYGISF